MATDGRRPPPRVLLVDDDASLREVMLYHLTEEGYDVTAARGGAEGLQLFEQEPFPVVVTDLKMPGLDGQGLLEAVLKRAPETLVIMVTAFGDMQTAVAAMKAGAFDFLPKPCEREHLKMTVRRAVEHAGLKRRVRELSEQLGSEGKPLLYRSAAMKKVVALADRVAATDATVLLYGESGTGKELVARRIHRESARGAGPWVAVNCGAIPRELLEAELFGHVKGAFTGALRARRGRFVMADGGRRASCGRCRSGRWTCSAARSRCRWTCASSPPPTATSTPPPATAASARTCTTASTSCPSTCRRCASDARTSRSWWTTSCTCTTAR
jgi:two-component system NtrC family response regulator